MKKTLLLATVPTMLALTACGDPATEAPSETIAVDDDNDAPAPVVEPVTDEEPHDESVPHDH